MTSIISTAQAQEQAPGAPADTHAEVGHEAAGEHGGAFPPFDPTYFGSQILWLVLTFGFFYWILSKKILPRMTGILEVRRDRIAADLGEAERMRVETDAAVAAYEQSLAEAKKKAGTIAAETRDRVKADLAARRSAIEADLSAKVGEAETRIAEIKARALGEVNEIATETTEAIVSALIGQGTRDEAASAVASVRKA